MVPGTSWAGGQEGSVPGERPCEALQGELSCEVSGPLVQPLPEQEGRGLPWSPRPTGRPCRLLLHPPRFSLAASGCPVGAGRPGAGLPEIGSTWGDVMRGVAKVSASLPPQTPALRPKHRVPGRGRGRSGSGRGQGAVRGRRAGRGNRGSPREGPAQPEAGLVQKTTCSFLGCLRLLKHTYSHTPGTATPTYGCTEHAGLGRWGCCQLQRSRVRRRAPQPPLVTDSTPFT